MNGTKSLFILLVVVGLGLATEPAIQQDLKPPSPKGGMRALQRHLYYPTTARDLGIDSQVLLQFRIGTDGRATHIKILESGGHVFDRAAIRAVERTKWEPAVIGDRKTSVHYRLPFHFVASGS